MFIRTVSNKRSLRMEKSATRDMTVGSPTKLIIKFSIPMLIGNLFQQFYNIVDSIIVGRFVDSNALAAVGATSAMVFLIIGLCFGLSAGISIVVSQYFGAKDYDNVRKSFATATYIIIGMAAILGVIGFFSSRWLLELLSTPDTIINQSDIFMKITFAGIFGTACYNGISAILRALGDSITPLKFLIIASILNVLLDLLFVIVFHWGVPGVAIATTLSQFVSAIGCTWYAIAKVKLLRMPLREFRPDKDIFMRCIRLGLPVALQNALVSISMMALQGIINQYNETVIAACTVISRIEQLVLQPGVSVGAAVAAFAGQNVGAGKIDRAKKGYYSATLIITVFSLLMLPTMYFGGKYIMLLFTKKEFIDVVTVGVSGIRITCFFYIWVGQILVSRNFLSGTGDINVVLGMGLTEVIFRILLANLLTMFLGYPGIWWATGLNWIATALVGIIRVASGRWKNKSIVRTA
jgi:putative MATE family efflux protein